MPVEGSREVGKGRGSPWSGQRSGGVGVDCRCGRAIGDFDNVFHQHTCAEWIPKAKSKAIAVASKVTLVDCMSLLLNLEQLQAFFV